MKLNKETLRRIIKEELEAVIAEAPRDPAVERGLHGLSHLTKANDNQAENFANAQQTLQSIKGTEDAIKGDKQKEKDIIDAANAMLLDGLTLGQAMEFVKRNEKRDWEMAGVIKKLYAALKKPKPSINDKYDAEEAKEKKGMVIQSKIIPWAQKNAKTLWQKSEASSAQEFKNGLDEIAAMDPGEAASLESELINILGKDLYNSIVNDRGFLDKFGGLFKRGTFSENKRRR